jgi:hypothetical protein
LASRLADRPDDGSNGSSAASAELGHPLGALLLETDPQQAGGLAAGEAQLGGAQLGELAAGTQPRQG